MSSSNDSPKTELQRVVSPTPSAKKRLSAMQRMKQLGQKLKPKRKSTTMIVEEVQWEPEEALVVAQLDTTTDPPEPSKLANHIRTLIGSFPTPSPTPVPPIRSDPPARDADGKPVVPAGAIRVTDEKLISLLSNAAFMNGKEEGEQSSVWAALDLLSAPENITADPATNAPNDKGGSSDGDAQDLDDVMLYVPLHPTDDSEVKLAQTAVINVPVSKLETAWQARWNYIWAHSIGLVKGAPAPETKPVKVWVPSTTQISFQAMWWGYRIYLPPPVMAHLNSDEAEAIKIATTVTAALTWFLANVSITQIPAPLQPAFLLVQKLGPYVGYIGTFVGWIWSAIQGKDKGNGVCLTATWLAPIILIPSSITPTTPTDPAPPTTTPTPPPTTTPPTTSS
ncbi:hypothetical protein HMN09_00042900 [Mycena chlorophos]|uniref:Uncharacterized protein n=1 Tax=Mycena chlorophos TaxID=658473 RepID=A0A8H6TRG3_MYCCL|nr:hypothetical protein HMN09_00042900 [Mycena chlorophos]